MQFCFVSDGRPRDLEFAVRHGIPALEFTAFHVPDLDDFHELMPRLGSVLARVPEVAACVRQGDVSIAAAGVWTDVMHPDVRLREGYRDALRQMLEVCGEVRSPILLTFAGDNPEWSYERKLDEFDAFFGPLISRGQELGVTLSVARCHWHNFAGSLAVWTELRRRHPSLGFKWDPTHGYVEGLDYVHELSTCAGWINHFHAKDMQIIGTQVYEDPPPGMGDIKWGRLMSVLYHAGYRGAISYELHSKLWLVDRRYEGILLAQRHLSQFLVPEGAV
jgi:sugar phosphate isomerase/epimerase